MIMDNPAGFFAWPDLSFQYAEDYIFSCFLLLFCLVG